MPVAKKQCATCPFRGATEAQIAGDAIVEPEHWGCHSDNPYGWTDMQCRGHWRARKKYPPSDAEVRVFQKWQDDFNKAFCAGADIDDLPDPPVRSVVAEMSMIQEEGGK